MQLSVETFGLMTNSLPYARGMDSSYVLYNICLADAERVKNLHMYMHLLPGTIILAILQVFTYLRPVVCLELVFLNLVLNEA